MGLCKDLHGSVSMPSFLERRFCWWNINWSRWLEEVSWYSGICQEWENGIQSTCYISVLVWSFVQLRSAYSLGKWSTWGHNARKWSLSLTLGHLILNLLLFLLFWIIQQGFQAWICWQTLLVDIQCPAPGKPSLPLSHRNPKSIFIQEGSITREMWKYLYAHGKGSGYPGVLELRASSHQVWPPGDRWLFCHRDEQLNLLSVAWRQKLQIKRCVPNIGSEFWLIAATLK